MRIRSSTPQVSTHRGKRSIFSLTVLKASILLAFTVLVAAVGTHWAFSKYFPEGIQHSLWLAAKSHGFAIFREDTRLRQAVTRIPTYLSRLASNPGLPKLSLDIAFKDLQKINAKRLQALQAGILQAGDDDYVPATIRIGERSLKVKLRLKGDNTDHLVGNKWSTRIHVKGDDQLFGLRSFSIQHPKTRGFQGEPMFHELAGQFGILTLKYLFADVTINGDNIGVMAIEEFFARELLERNGRKEGVILKYDESLMWSARDMEHFYPKLLYHGPFESELTADIRAFQSSKIARSASLTRDYGVAVGLLRGFTRGQLKASEVFDIELLGSYLAVCEFWGASHALLWTNQRFYFNPLSLRLEPIAYDSDLDIPIRMGASVSVLPWVRRMLNDPVIYKVFRRVHDDLVAQLRDGTLKEKLDRVELPVLDILRSEFFMLEPWDYAVLEERAEKVPRVLRKYLEHGRLPAYIHAFLYQDDSGDTLEILNAVPYDVEVQDIGWINDAGDRIPFEPITAPEFPIALSLTAIGAVPRSVSIKFVPPPEVGNLRLVVRTSVKGYEEFKESIAVRSYAPLRENPMPHAEISEQLALHPFLSVSDSERKVEIAAGAWQVRGDVIIPQGYALSINGDTRLRFEEAGSLVVFGATEFLGSAGAEIILEGMPVEDGGNGYWEGIAVFNAPERSTWSYVTVRNTTGVSWPVRKLTGGTTFFKSDIDIENSTFTGAAGEDALNIVHADFRMTDVQVSDVSSDGFDADFATGAVTGGIFRDIGIAGSGDGMEFSGSTVIVDGTHFERVRDNAISATENSELTAQGVSIEDSGVGALSKDNSALRILRSTIRLARKAALVAYSQKPEFGPATLVADDIVISDTRKEAQVQPGSTLVLNGEQVRKEDFDVDELMKPE